MCGLKSPRYEEGVESEHSQKCKMGAKPSKALDKLDEHNVGKLPG